LNDRAPLLFAELRRRGVVFSVRHLCGRADPAPIKRLYTAAGVTAQVDSFVDSNSVYAGAALALTSAGARTLAELAAAGVPSLLIPLEGAARNHQTANAHLYASQVGGLLVDKPLEIAAIAARIEKLLSNPSELRSLALRTAGWAQPNAARALVHVCERYLFASRPVKSESLPVSVFPHRSVSNDAGPWIFPSGKARMGPPVVRRKAL
jgi:UDP-N-acetylglucosamine--N-acetylmuramyl-(pentapeptide) pyrophosphoryl-undecaprenol N-acetylglucosamine transferase